MKPVTRIVGPGLALPRDNIDTDQLIPARFMSRSRGDGYGDQLFYDLRFDPDGHPAPDSPFSAIPGRPAVLVAGDNFGCGSSREAAVYALVDHGIGAVIAKSFADIFRSNAARNGLLTITPDETDRNALIEALTNTPGATVAVDLESCRVTGPGDMAFAFTYDPALRARLLSGLDDLSATLLREDSIARFTAVHLDAAPWIVPRNDPVAK